MDESWVKIYANTFGPKVDLIKLQLQNEGIMAIILNQQDSAHVHIGEIELYVREEHLQRSKRLIETWENE